MSKPDNCPCCGSDNVDCYEKGIVWLCECMTCFLRQHTWAKDQNSHEEAIAKWNKRTRQVPSSMTNLADRLMLECVNPLTMTINCVKAEMMINDYINQTAKP